MSYRVIIDGDGEAFWLGFDYFNDAVQRFQEEQLPARKVTLEWEHFDYEEE